MAANAFTKIQSTTLQSSQNNITFSSIPQTYTDLQLTVSTRSANSGDLPYFRFGTGNTEDTGSNYTKVYQGMYGDTATQTPTLLRGFFTDQTYLVFNQVNTPVISSSLRVNYVINIFNYTNTTWHKSGLAHFSHSLNGNGYTSLNETHINAILWSNTGALNYIKIYSSANDFGIGTTASLYGIKAA